MAGLDRPGPQSRDSAAGLPVPVVSSSVHPEPGFGFLGPFDDVETSGRLSCQNYSLFQAWRHQFAFGMSCSSIECCFTDALEVSGTL